MATITCISTTPYRHGPTEAQAPQVKALGSEWRGFWVAAIRETFEEAGLLLAAYDQHGEMISFADEATHNRFAAYRDPLHDGEVTLLDVVRARIPAFSRGSCALLQPFYYAAKSWAIRHPFFIASAPEKASDNSMTGKEHEQHLDFPPRGLGARRGQLRPNERDPYST